MQIQSASIKVNTGQVPRRLVVALVHPTNYDHSEGSIGQYPQTYVRGVIPCNTLRLLQGLTEEAVQRPALAGIATEVHAFEDALWTDQRAFGNLLRRFPEKGTLLVVGFVAVQTNQFPRAMDLMARVRGHGGVSVIGGPHITAGINASFYGISRIDPLRGGIPCPQVIPPEIQQLLDDPCVVVFHGDADARCAWARVLEDLTAGRAAGYYEAGLAAEVGPVGRLYSPAQINAYVAPVVAVDTERGCPFKCRFCAAIQAHGREVRARHACHVVDWVRAQCRAYGRHLTVLFASDNLARNPHWRELLEGLAVLKQQGVEFSLWAEADVRCDSGPNKGFLELYARAGGQGLFFGIESMNPANLESAGKRQNDVEELPGFFARCRALGISPEGGYIIGFAADTPDSVVRDVQALVDAGLTRAWFFIKTLLPGSQDWVEAVVAGKALNPDLNDYDSTVVANEHETMTDAEWQAAYHSAVRTFYSPANMVRILSRYPEPAARWRQIKAFLWCRWAYLAERSHPMIAGLCRMRTLRERRPGGPPLLPWRYVLSEAWRGLRYVGLFFREFYVFQQVILESEWQLKHAPRWDQLGRDVRDWRDWTRRTFGAPMRREWLNRFWVRYGSQKWQLMNPLRFRWHLSMLPHALTEVVYTARFSCRFLRGLLLDS